MSRRTCTPDTQQTSHGMHRVRCRTPCRSPSMHIHQSPPPYCCRSTLCLPPPALRVHELPFRCPRGSYSAIMCCGDGRRRPSSSPSGSLRQLLRFRAADAAKAARTSLSTKQHPPRSSPPPCLANLAPTALLRKAVRITVSDAMLTTTARAAAASDWLPTTGGGPYAYHLPPYG
jgi:hypothetical protein